MKSFKQGLVLAGRGLCLLLLVVLLAGLAWGLLPASPVGADTPIYVRPGGDDGLCAGTANRDYSPAAAPDCAVRTIGRAVELAGSGGTIVAVSGNGTAAINLDSLSTAADSAVTSLEVRKRDRVDPVLVGTPLTYTMRITNTGAGAASNVVMFDILPPGTVAFRSAAASQGGCSLDAAATVLTCTLGTLNSSASALVTLVLTPTAAGPINNVAIATSPSATTVVDQQPTTIEGITNLSVSKIDTPDPVFLGSPLAYTITVSNSGPSAAAVVTLTDTLPAGVLFGSASPGCGHNAGTVACNLGLLVSSAARVITLSVTPTSLGLITNTVQVASGALDPNPANNVATATTTVQPPLPALSLLKSAQPAGGSTVTAGSGISYTVVIRNTGGPASSFVLTDTIPAGAAYVPGSAAWTPGLGSLSFSSGQVLLNVPQFPANSTMTVTFRVSVTSLVTTTLTNQALARSQQSSLQSSNVVTHLVRGAGGGLKIYLPIIFKSARPPSIPSVSLAWDGLEPVRDKVRGADGGAGLTPDGKTDGVFRLQLDPGSGSKTVDWVSLASSQGAGIIWDTINGNSRWVLGIFDGGTRLNQADGTVNQAISGPLTVRLYASDTDPASLFPPDTYTYTVTVHFTDGTSLSAQARIPAGWVLPPVPPPSTSTPVPLPPADCPPKIVATISVGQTPRGLAVDTSRANRVYVANFGSGSLSVIQDNSVAQVIAGIPGANGVAYDRTNDLIWVTNYGANQVTPIRASDRAILAPVAVGRGPWGVAHNSANNYVYVANSLDNTVTVINGTSRAVVATLSHASFNQPFHLAANPVTGKTYASNFGSAGVTVMNGTAVSKAVSLVDGSQPYGIAVDETRNLVYVATVNSHLIAVIGELSGVADELLGWAAFHRGFNDPARPVPLRVIALNPALGPAGDGGHVWATTAMADGSEANQVLLIPKGWGGYFHLPIARPTGANPLEGIAVDRVTNRVYVSSGTSAGTVTVLQDGAEFCLEPFALEPEFGFDLHLTR